MKTNPTNILLWLIVSLLGASAVGGIALHRGESINALWFITAALCIYAISYRFYAAWIAATVLSIDPSRATPAERLSNGRDSVSYTHLDVYKRQQINIPLHQPVFKDPVSKAWATSCGVSRSKKLRRCGSASSIPV